MKAQAKTKAALRGREPRTATGIQASGWWKNARWIWPSLHCYNLHNSYALFRKEFRLDAVPRQAPALVTADQNYRLWVNGRVVCRGPARGYQESWPFDEADLAPFLKKGKNVITARVHNCGHSTFGYLSKGGAGFLLAAKIGRKVVLTDAGWRCRNQSEIRRDTVPYSLQLGVHQEFIDLRAGEPDWQRAGFDDSAWGLPHGGGLAWNAPPYAALEPRGIPLLREWNLRPKCIGGMEGAARGGWRECDDAAGHRASEPLGHSSFAGGVGRVRVPATPRGRFRSFLFDFGRVVVGSPVIHVEGARGGETVDFLHTEVLEPGSLAPRPSRNDHSHIRLGNRLVCRKGTQFHSFHQHLGFRYLTVTVRENAKPIDIRVALDACGYPMEGEGDFQCADPSLAAVWRACAHTQRICALDAYVDTPWREQAQWWGDARIQAWNTYHLNGDTRLLRRGIRILAGQATPDGLTFGHAPTIAQQCVLPDFALIWILTLWDDYWQTGSTVMLETYAGRVRSILDYFQKHSSTATGLPVGDPRYWLFLDWRPIHKEGQPALLALWLLFSLGRLAEMARVADIENQFPEVAQWHARLEASICERLLRKDGLVCDGLDAKGKPVRNASLQSQTLAWLCDLPGFDRRKALDTVLLPWVRGEKKTPLDPSSYWCAYPLDLLAREGHGPDVVSFIRTNWAEMAEFGSAFEDFDPKPAGKDMSSHSHAWSAHPLYLLMRILAGVRQAAPGWKKISLRPDETGIPCRIIFPTPHGPVLVEKTSGHRGRLQTKVTKPPAVRIERGSISA